MNLVLALRIKDDLSVFGDFDILEGIRQVNEDMLKTHFPNLEYFIPAPNSCQSECVLFKNGDTLACFTATASFPFILKMINGCNEVRNLEDFRRTIELSGQQHERWC